MVVLAALGFALVVVIAVAALTVVVTTRYLVIPDVDRVRIHGKVRR